MSEEKPVTLSDICGIWSGGPDHVTVPCNCCGTCSCTFHDGERHDGKDWCFICVGRDHHIPDPADEEVSGS